MEIWKKVFDYYEVSNLGNVVSLNYNKTGKRKAIKPHIVNKYMKVGVFIGRVQKIIPVHRLVAMAFVENKNNKPYVHHIDHNKLNNSAENLMWVTQSENVRFSYTDGGRTGKTNMKGLFGELNPCSLSIKRIGKDGSYTIIKGISEAARMVSGSASHIVKCCKGKLNKYKGYKWEYV